MPNAAFRLVGTEFEPIRYDLRLRPEGRDTAVCGPRLLAATTETSLHDFGRRTTLSQHPGHLIRPYWLQEHRAFGPPLGRKPWKMWPRPSPFGAAILAAGLAAGIYAFRRSGRQRRIIESPRRRVLQSPQKEIDSLPYPPGLLPGGRDVSTPLGSIRVYEWGPIEGAKVVLVHGITTPCPALGDLGHELASRGFRVILFGK